MMDLPSFQSASALSRVLRRREGWHPEAVVSDPPGRLLAEGRADALARVLVAGLFLGLAVRIGQNVLETGRVIGLLLLGSELLVVVLMLVRRAAVALDRSSGARAIAAVSLLGPPLVQPTTTAGLLPEMVTVALSACGLVIVIAGKIALGRSFGFMPANRGIVCAGPYKIVRHPIYAGYVLTHVAFAAANPTWWNVLVLAGADGALLRRAVYEERVLARDMEYLDYRARVRWRLVPGVF